MFLHETWRSGVGKQATTLKLCVSLFIYLFLHFDLWRALIGLNMTVDKLVGLRGTCGQQSWFSEVCAGFPSPLLSGKKIGKPVRRLFICERSLLSYSAGWSFEYFQKPYHGEFDYKCPMKGRGGGGGGLMIMLGINQPILATEWSIEMCINLSLQVSAASAEIQLLSSRLGLLMWSLNTVQQEITP